MQSERSLSCLKGRVGYVSMRSILAKSSTWVKNRTVKLLVWTCQCCPPGFSSTAHFCPVVRVPHHPPPPLCLPWLRALLSMLTGRGEQIAWCAGLLRALRGMVDRLTQREVGCDDADEARSALREMDVLLRNHAPADARAQHAAPVDQPLDMPGRLCIMGPCADSGLLQLLQPTSSEYRHTGWVQGAQVANEAWCCEECRILI